MSIPAIEFGKRIPKGLRVIRCDGCFKAALQRDGHGVAPQFDEERLAAQGWSVPGDGKHWCPDCVSEGRQS